MLKVEMNTMSLTSSGRAMGTSLPLRRSYYHRPCDSRQHEKLIVTGLVITLQAQYTCQLAILPTSIMLQAATYSLA